MTAKITTIIPTYQRPRMLERALRSVLRQTVGDFQVCVYDNASGDETPEVVARMSGGDPRVSYYRQPENIGGGPNFLFGMRRVVTPYFSFLSDDDVLLPHFYETALAGFERSPGAMMSAASTIEVNGDGTMRYAPLSRWPRTGLFNPPEGAFLMLGNRHPTWTTILFRREVLDDVGYLDVDVGAPSDLDYELRLALRFPIVVSARPCGAYVSHSGSGSAAETADVAEGYERIRRNIAADERIDLPVRRRMSALILRQLRTKLFEVWVKSLVRGDDRAANAAAVRLRDRYGAHAEGIALDVCGRACARVGFLRSLLRWVESVRLSLRARASDKGGVAASALPDIREALAL